MANKGPIDLEESVRNFFALLDFGWIFRDVHQFRAMQIEWAATCDMGMAWDGMGWHGMTIGRTC